MSLTGLHGHAAPSHCDGLVEQNDTAASGICHSVTLETDYVSAERAQMIGLVSQFNVRFERLNFVLRDSLDPRLGASWCMHDQHESDRVCRSISLGNRGDLDCLCDIPWSWPFAADAVPMVKGPIAKQANSALHVHKHVIPLRVSFDEAPLEDQEPSFSWPRQLNDLVAKHPHVRCGKLAAERISSVCALPGQSSRTGCKQAAGRKPRHQWSQVMKGEPLQTSNLSPVCSDALHVQAKRCNTRDSEFAPSKSPSHADRRSKVVQNICLDTSIPCQTNQETGEDTQACLMKSHGDLDAIEVLQDGHRLRDFSFDLQALGELHPNSKCVLANMTCWNRRDAVQEVRLYTDGSFVPSSEILAWAVVAIVQANGQWMFGGYIAGTVDTQRFERPIEPNSHAAEVCAMIHGLMATSCIDAMVTVVYDCASAAQVVTQSSKEFAALTDVAVALGALLKRMGRWPQWRHTRSHQGDPFNELADCVAKWAWRRQQPNDHDHVLVSLVEAPGWSWLWVHWDAQMRPHAWPIVTENGSFLERSGGRWSSGHLKDQEGGNKSCQTGASFDVTMVTYNCLSLKPTAQQDILAEGMNDAGACLIGLQETRTDQCGPEANNLFTKFAAPAVKGSEGCQLWFSKHNAVGRLQNGKLLYWEPGSFTVHHSHERCLAVSARAGGVLFSCVTAHARTAVSDTADIENFWRRLEDVMQRLPENAVKLLLVDANASFDVSRSLNGFYSPLDANAECMLQLARRCQLSISSPWDPKGERVYTWVSPTGFRKGLDYVLAPGAYQAHLTTVGTVQDVRDVYAGVDHEPLLVKLEFQTDAEGPQKKAVSFDLRKIPENDDRARTQCSSTDISAHAFSPVGDACFGSLASCSALPSRSLPNVFSKGQARATEVLHR